MRISDWSSDVCSSDLVRSKEKVELAALGRKMYDEIARRLPNKVGDKARAAARERLKLEDDTALYVAIGKRQLSDDALLEALVPGITAEMKSKPGKLKQGAAVSIEGLTRSEEHTSELQSLMRTSYA